ncbi:mdn1 [Cordylochernes scorpioides]|uniref:Mdn1 n=1 Tax=Cordylochernes scorpioides TaxID=51811 RepID=A0ABY6KFZ4_9ARAC|nr:mdn1 [Cordylochernes scorpioides]
MELGIGDHPIPPIKLVLAALRLLFQDFPFFSSLWNWAPVLDMLKHSDEELRWLSFRLISVVAGLPPLDIAQPSLVSTQLPLLLKRLKLSKPLKDIQVNHSIIGDGKVLSKVLLPISNSKEKPLQPFYQDSISIQKTMQNMALGITAGQPLLLQGPIGSGKTTLIAQLANKTGRGSELIKVQLGDQMDSKKQSALCNYDGVQMLIGGYCCTNIPGEFVWRPGPLTQAMEKGRWLVLEDVDLAPMDVVSLLVPVLQSNTLVLPGRSQPLRAAPGFHLLATKRLVAGETRFYSESSTHADMLCKLWKKISVMPLSREDLSAMITTRWPHLEPLVSNILELYFIFSQGGHDGEYDRNHQHVASYGQHRTPSTR